MPWPARPEKFSRHYCAPPGRNESSRLSSPPKNCPAGCAGSWIDSFFAGPLTKLREWLRSHSRLTTGDTADWQSALLCSADCQSAVSRTGSPHEPALCQWAWRSLGSEAKKDSLETSSLSFSAALIQYANLSEFHRRRMDTRRVRTDLSQCQSGGHS